MILSASLQIYLKKIHVKKAYASITLMMLLALSLGPYALSLKSTDAQPTDEMCEKLPVVKVGANGVRGAASAQFAVDGNPVTRWANQATGSFVQLDLGL